VAIEWIQKKLPAIETSGPRPLAVWLSCAVGIRFTLNVIPLCTCPRMGEILVVRRLGDRFFRALARDATGQSKIAAITVFRRQAPRRLFLGPATFLPLLVYTPSIFLVVALPPGKDLFPVRLVPPRIISTAMFTALLALAFGGWGKTSPTSSPTIHTTGSTRPT
jgi:hypothetical protein